MKQVYDIKEIYEMLRQNLESKGNVVGKAKLIVNTSPGELFFGGPVNIRYEVEVTDKT